jgi:hypothetical protein
MKEISLHILDIVQNSLQAEASEICIEVNELINENQYRIVISDDGIGMSEEQIKNVLDPFFTTKNKKTGLGLPLLKQHAELAGGTVSIKKGTSKGITVTATFEHENIDRQPLGDIACTLTGIIRANPGLHLTYKHSYNDNTFIFDTEEFKNELGDIPINSAEVLNFMAEFVRDNLNEISSI